MQLLVCVLNKTECLGDIMESLSNSGLYGATILNSKGMAHYLTESNEFAFMESLIKILNPDNSESRTFFMVIDDDKIKTVSKIINYETGGLDKPDTGVIFTLPVGYTEGFGCADTNESS